VVGATELLDKPTADFANLFMGSLEAFGTEEGGCDRPDPAVEPLVGYMDRVAAHLFGDTPMGVYPQYNSASGGTTWCGWGCVDFDEGEDESWIHAVNLVLVLQQFGVHGWVERSRTRGYHVWVFPEEHVIASLMRRALLGACQVAGSPTKEINPKQETLGVGQVGNYVRLPYPRYWEAANRRCMVDDLREPITLATFLNRARSSLANERQLAELAKLYLAPSAPKPTVHVSDDYTPVGAVPGLVLHMIEHGPLSGEDDRSAWLWRLCRVMHERNVAYAEARSALGQADERWGKFHLRRDGDDVLDRMLAKAYGVR
jgi:hypothetical protein